MRVSVIICTRNRAQSLRRTLTSIANAELPSQPWELLVVDNGSTDTTEATINGFSAQLPVRRVAAPIAGLSNARNEGVTAARGEYIVWTDDDVIVDRLWLTAYIEAFERHPNDAVFAGQIVPQLEEPATVWFQAGAALLGDLMARRTFPSVIALSEDILPYGANYALRGEEQRSHLYDPSLGVAPGRRGGGEETSLVKSVLAKGLSGHTVPGSVVYHQIPPSRQTYAYVAEYYRWLGSTSPLEMIDVQSRYLLNVPLWLWRQACIGQARLILAYAARRNWLPLLIEHAIIMGKVERWRNR